MADPLTLSVMSQIARKAGWKEYQPETTITQEPHSTARPHLTEHQGVLLSELINKKKAGPSTAKTSTATQRKESVMSLDALVNSAKTR